MQIGAYAVERDYSHYVAYAAKTVFAVVGTASKGPVNVPTVCTSAQDLVNRFGTPREGDYGLYAAQYFLNQSSKVYFVRATPIATVGVPEGASTDDDIGIIFRLINTTDHLDEGVKYTLSAEGPADKLTLYRNGVVIEETKLSEIDLEVGYKTDYLEIVDLPYPDMIFYNHTNLEFTMPEETESASYITALNTLATESIDMNLFAVPGVSDRSVILAAQTIAEGTEENRGRGDCLFLVDPPKGLSRDEVVNWRKGTTTDTTTGTGNVAFNSDYCALYYDWVTIFDPYNKKNVDVPPSVVVSAVYAYSDRTSEVWYAPAGLNRGIIRGAISSVTQLSKGDVEYLYENGINAIYQDPQAGLVVWGQKTLSSSDTALNRVNVRRLMNYLKRVITAACNYLTFEPNDRITWNSFEMKILPVLKNVKDKRGIYEYRVVKGDTIITDQDVDNYRMPCLIAIRPTKAAEEIPIHFTITSTGADFNEVLDANGIVNI